MLNRGYQPTTVDPNKLLIGIAHTSVNSIDLGAITNTNIEITSTVKERYVGYPAQRHETTTESINAITTVTVEEIGSPTVQNLLRALFNCSTNTYNLEMFAPQAGGGNLKLTALAQLLPELSLDWQDDWSGIQFKFEAVGINAQALLGRSIEAGPRQSATTLNTDYLAIGKPKVLINGQSVGAIQSAQITMQGQVKKVERGYPRCTASIIILDNKFEITLLAEEQITQGSDVEVTIQQALVNGNMLEIKFPHCKVLEDLGVNPKNDWVGIKQKILPFKVDSSQLVIF
jgi:hypothetical protein